MIGVPPAKLPLARKLGKAIESLGHLIGPVLTRDERGDYVSGFRSQAIWERARACPAEGGFRWRESEAARLIELAVIHDGDGPRRLARFVDDEDRLLDAILASAKALIPERIRSH